MSSRPECPACGERWCMGGATGEGVRCIDGLRERYPETNLYPNLEQPVPCAPKFYLCFLDFETTGLNPTRHEPIEVAAVVTDDRLNELGRFESLIVPEGGVGWWEKPALDMHAASGLFHQCMEYGAAREIVEADLLRFLRVVPASAPLHLAGNSVHFDRGFLRAYFPAVEQRFHHRHLDVSSLRIAASVFAPGAAPLAGTAPHRAMADVLRSIQELHHWRAALRGP